LKFHFLFYYFFKLTVWIVIVVLRNLVAMLSINQMSHGNSLILNRFHFWSFPNSDNACQSDIVFPLWLIHEKYDCAFFICLLFFCVEIRINVIHSSCNQFYVAIKGWSQTSVWLSGKNKNKPYYDFLKRIYKSLFQFLSRIWVLALNQCSYFL